MRRTCGFVDRTLKDVLFTLEVRRNLFSVTRLCKMGIHVVYSEDTMVYSLMRGKVTFDPKDVVGMTLEKLTYGFLMKKGRQQ